MKKNINNKLFVNLFNGKKKFIKTAKKLKKIMPNNAYS
jgi:hypothetical protein